jgi:hypothetical protein
MTKKRFDEELKVIMENEQGKAIAWAFGILFAIASLAVIATHWGSA